jgi:hypothetical protein
MRFSGAIRKATPRFRLPNIPFFPRKAIRRVPWNEFRRTASALRDKTIERLTPL